ncbi:Uncharacterized protein PBTT_01339 [Plasmodiophora brassicae]
MTTRRKAPAPARNGGRVATTRRRYTLGDVPDGVLTNALAWLAFDDLLRVACVDRRFERLLEQDARLWALSYGRRFPNRGLLSDAGASPADVRRAYWSATQAVARALFAKFMKAMPKTALMTDGGPQCSRKIVDRLDVRLRVSVDVRDPGGTGRRRRIPLVMSLKALQVHRHSLVGKFVSRHEIDAGDVERVVVRVVSHRLLSAATICEADAPLEWHPLGRSSSALPGITMRELTGAPGGASVAMVAESQGPFAFLIVSAPLFLICARLVAADHRRPIPVLRAPSLRQRPTSLLLAVRDAQRTVWEHTFRDMVPAEGAATTYRLVGGPTHSPEYRLATPDRRWRFRLGALPGGHFPNMAAVDATVVGDRGMRMWTCCRMAPGVRLDALVDSEFAALSFRCMDGRAVHRYEVADGDVRLRIDVVDGDDIIGLDLTLPRT